MINNKNQSKWRSIPYMRNKYGGSASYWYKRTHFKTIPYSKPTGGRVLIDEAFYLEECEASRIEPNSKFYVTALLA